VTEHIDGASDRVDHGRDIAELELDRVLLGICALPPPSSILA
jgi:hypothetical protein